MESQDRAVLIVQHVDVEGPGLIGCILEQRDVRTTIVGPAEPLPSNPLAEARGLILLGGPMSVRDSAYRRLRDELSLIESALTRRVPLLGICLGSQLLAAALGAPVRRGSRLELGWHEVSLEPAAASDQLFAGAPARFRPLHWHGDVFELPHGAAHLASSDLTRHQAFSYGGTAWGLLFHLEAGLPEVERMMRAFPEEIAQAGQSSETLLAETEKYAPSMADLGHLVFQRWIDLLA